MKLAATAPYTTRVDLRDLAAIVMGLERIGLRPRSRSEAITMAVEFASDTLVAKYGFVKPATVEEAIAILKSLNMVTDRQLHGRRSVMQALALESEAGVKSTVVDPALVAEGMRIMKQLEEEDRAKKASKVEQFSEVKP